MKNRYVKISLCLILVVCLLVPSFSLSAFAAENTAIDSGVSIESGKVYYIENQKSNLYLDVYGEYTADGSVVKHDYFNGGLNQQFKVVRISGDIYEIIPMHAQDKRVDISNGSAENDALVQIYTSNSTNTQRFKIVDDGNGTGSFKILTGTTSYEKCITNQYASTTPTNVVQYGYGNEGIADNDHWYFEKVDSIGVNLERNVNIGRNSFNEFTLAFEDEYIFQNVTYILETVGDSDTKLELYHDGEYMFGDDDSGDGYNAKLVFTPNSDDGLTVKVKMYGTQCGSAKLRLRPKNQVYANSYNGDINTMEDVYQVYEHFNKLDLYVNHHVNTNPLGNGVFTTNPIMNNRFYFMTAHGNAGSVTYAPGARFTTAALPTMTNVELVVWAVCHGADAPAGGTSMVEQSITNGADYALGWHGVTYVGTSRTFTTYLWKNIGNGQSVVNAVSNAIDSTRSYYWIKQITGWGDDPILSPVLRSAPTSSSGGTTRSIDTNIDYEEEIEEIVLMDEDLYLENTYNYQKYVASNQKTVYIKRINGILTNTMTIIESTNAQDEYTKIEINDIDTSTISSVDLTTYSSEDAIVESFFYIVINNEYHLVQRTQIDCGDAIEEIYFDITASELLTEDFVMNAFNYGG